MGEGTPEASAPDLIPGYHAVRRALQRGLPRIREIWLLEGKDSSRTREIVRMAGERNIPVRFRKAAELDRALPLTAHQGMVACSGRFVYWELEAVAEAAQRSPGWALIVVADHITDEGNLGAVIRTGAFFGAHGLIIPKDRAAGVTPNVLKRASGAHPLLPVARVVNLGRTLDVLNKMGFWIIGTSGKGPTSLYRFDWRRDLAVVLGSEQKGLGRAVAKHCHEMVQVPAVGGLESLNVAVACGVVLSEITRQRSLPGGSR